jgi:hypothetical protein
MARFAEIYPRTPDDPYYVPDVIETDDIVEITIGMIKQIMLTSPGEVLGDPGFGINLESLLFDFEVSQSQLQQAIGLQLYTYCPPSRDLLDINYRIGFFKGETRDACVIEFAIKGNPILGIRII